MYFVLVACGTSSFHTRIQRYGLIILLLHDMGDIFLNWAKVFKCERAPPLISQPPLSSDV